MIVHRNRPARLSMNAAERRIERIVVHRRIDSLLAAGAADPGNVGVTNDTIRYGVELALTRHGWRNARAERRAARDAARLALIAAREQDLIKEVTTTEQHLAALEMELAARDGTSFLTGASLTRGGDRR